jgi:hypothetical protein
MVMSTIALWLQCAYHEEDVQLRSTDWKEHCKNKCIIMWDNTNLDFMGKPTDADLQRLTFLLYYGGNVVRGDVLFGSVVGLEQTTYGLGQSQTQTMRRGAEFLSSSVSFKNSTHLISFASQALRTRGIDVLRLPVELVDSCCSNHSFPEVTASSQPVKFYYWVLLQVIVLAMNALSIG